LLIWILLVLASTVLPLQAKERPARALGTLR
jgi:hypothetical protein